MKQNKNIVIGLIVLLGIVGVVSAVPSVQLIDSNANDYLNVYEYNTSIHNNLSGLQGGAAGEYYHLTSAEYTTLGTLVAATGDYLNLTGGTMSGDINMDGNSLTSVGKTNHVWLNKFKGYYSYITQSLFTRQFNTLVGRSTYH